MYLTNNDRKYTTIREIKYMPLACLPLSEKNGYADGELSTPKDRLVTGYSRDQIGTLSPFASLSVG